MDFWIRLIAEYGLFVVFFNVLLEQLGVPIPTYPVLMVSGALAVRGQLSMPALLGVAVVACLIADTVWYLAGQRYGRRVLRVLCKVSLSPDSCVRQTETIFTRWGAPSLMVARFVPGFASVATALAGAMRIGRLRFLLFDALGATLWIGVGLSLGALFSNAVESVLGTLAALGKWGLGLLLAAVLAFVATKWWKRRNFNRMLRTDRMSVAALAALIDEGARPVVVDARTAASWAEGRIPGAVLLVEGELPAEVGGDRDALIVVYCDCPNDASAVLTARRLLERGFGAVKPLAGGLDAWVAAGRSLER